MRAWGRMGGGVLAIAGVLSGSSLAAADGMPGDLDSAFGTAGVATFGDAICWGAAVRPSDGAIATAGSHVNGGSFNNLSTQDWAVRLFTSDGQADTAFGSGGLRTHFGQYGADVAFAVGFDSSGRVLAAGTTRRAVVTGSGRKQTTSYLARGAVIRLTTSGALDTTFGVGGEVLLDFPVQAMQIQANDTILVAGSSNGDPVVGRLLAGGALDTTYGSGGLAVDTRFTDACGRVMNVAVQSSGAAVIGWRATRTEKVKGSTTNRDVWCVTRMTSAGQVDSTFSTSAQVDDLLGGLVVGPDDRIYASGITGPSNARDVLVTAMNANGTLDGSFGSSGEAAYAPYDMQISVGTPALQADGAIVIPTHHYSGGEWAAAPVRFLADGTLDDGFGLSGEGASLDLGSGVQTRSWSTALATDSGILLVGDYVGPPNGSFLARYAP